MIQLEEQTWVAVDGKSIRSTLKPDCRDLQLEAAELMLLLFLW